MRPEEARKKYARSLQLSELESFRSLRGRSPWRGVDCWAWPGLLTEPEWDFLAQKFEGLTARLLTKGQKILAEESWLEWLPAEPGLLQAMRDDPAGVAPQVVWRFDFIWERESQHIGVLEVQAGDPSGMGWVDARAADYSSLPSWQRLTEEIPLRYPSLSKSLVSAFSQLTGLSSPRALFLAARESSVAGDIEELASQCALHGASCQVLDPQDITRELLENSDVAYRDTYEELYWPPYQQGGALLLEAYKQGKLTLVNPLSSNLWDSKALFSKLSQGEVLETRRLLTFDSTILLREREEWVLKPNFHYGGHGITLGPDCSEELWRARVEEALEEPESWIVQRYVNPEMESFPLLTPSGLQWEERFVTWSAWIHLGKLAGVYVRASTQKITNVHQGGALMPCFVMEV